jgi:hypothetical protein
MHVQNALQNAFDAAIARKHLFCLLVDTAQAENSHLMLDRWGISYESLFDGTPEATLLEVAPLLISVNELDASTRARLFAWAQQLAYSSPAISWLEVDATASLLADHLRHFHVVGLSEGQVMLMRWYDTRILPVWFSCLTAEQLEIFAAKIVSWRYVDRAGGVAPLPTTKYTDTFPVAPPFGRPMLTLTDSQYGVLVDSADLDILLKHLRRVIPDEIRQVPDLVLVQFVAFHLQDAAQAGLHDVDSQVQYLLLALFTSGKGVEHPVFKAFMKSRPATLNDLSQGIQDLPEEVWNAGGPLWATEALIHA